MTTGRGDSRPPRPAAATTVAAAAAAAIVVALLVVSGCAGLRRPNVLLVVIDTARADRFSADGYGRDTTPAFDALGREGAVYDHAFSPAPWTIPAHASLFTGLFPSAHGTDAGHLWLDEDRATIAELFRDAGYRTLGYIGNPAISTLFNFQQGFDTYDDVWKRVTRKSGDTGAGQINEAIGKWLAWRAGNPEACRQPFFLFVNYVEPHLPYDPPDPERSRFLRPGSDPAAVARLREVRQPEHLRYILGARSFTEAEIAILSDLYDGEIAYADRRVGELVGMLRRERLLDDTVVVVTSDHGEMIGEHRFLGHELNVYDPLLKIPLLIRYPRAVRPGQRISEPVMLQDLFPTLLRLAGLRPPDPPTRNAGLGPEEAAPLPGVSGVGGTGRAARPGDPDPIVAEYARPVTLLIGTFREVAPEGDPAPWDRTLVAWRSGDAKLHWASDGGHRLFDVAADPGEARDLADHDPRRVEEIARAARHWLERHGARPPVGLSGTASPIPPGVHLPPEALGIDPRLPPVPHP